MPDDSPSNAMPYKFSEQQLADFRRDGFVIVRREQFLSDEQRKRLLHETKTMVNWPEVAGSKYWKFYEHSKMDVAETSVTVGDRLLCRIEKFLDETNAINDVVTDLIGGCCTQLFRTVTGDGGETAVLYKEKVNLKLPGADGFLPHQDQAAGWTAHGSIFISALLAIDDATEANGCLQVVRGEHRNGLLGPEWAAVPDSCVQKFAWEDAPTRSGDVIFFDSFVPHRSQPNPTPRPRRIMYLTYGRQSEGDHRSEYYAAKFQNFPPEADRDPNKSYAYKI